MQTEAWVVDGGFGGVEEALQLAERKHDVGRVERALGQLEAGGERLGVTASLPHEGENGADQLGADGDVAANRLRRSARGRLRLGHGAYGRMLAPVNGESIQKVLVIGSGAREHALARAMLRGREGRQVIIAPGNGGSEGQGAQPGLSRMAVDVNRIDDVVALAARLKPDLVVIGPEAPLCAGVVDALVEAGFVTFGPSKAAARLEASKVFIKELATRAGIPTAAYEIVRDLAAAERAIEARGAPLVIKADGLCAGKGVVVAKTKEEALDAAHAMLVDKTFGDAGNVVVVEECLVGREVSLHAISDGERYVLLPPARDHKRIFDGDRGPNTGGMGVVCPASDIGKELVDRIDRELIEPTLRRMREEGAPFRGVLFAGVMVTEKGPMLLEHNVRFGDPECEAMLELIEGDLALVLQGAALGKLDPASLKVRTDRSAVVVIMAAEGYPATPVSGDRITGIDRAEALGVTVFHAGTKLENDHLLTSGGRVLAVAASGASLREAQELAYRGCKAIDFRGKQYRRDIGKSTLELGTKNEA